jgi:hypothetical protein
VTSEATAASLFAQYHDRLLRYFSRAAGEREIARDHVIHAVTGQLSKKMLEHYSHQRLKAKGQMLTRMEERRKKKESA